ncbi:MAG: Gfo/Idh/MocA family oxidoreductase [Phycisphaerae bacterium]|nr:Gfo/Idh/MocA family oxidoreductase [Phycisphaerae bacterium]
MPKLVKWGILGCGGIAEKFARELHSVPGCQLAAVASRSQGKADDFAARHKAQQAYGSYAQAVQDPRVTIFYVASPHSAHYDNVKLCLENGKAVLCEKPITLNAAQASRLAILAKNKGLFLMEGMWTRFLPSMIKLRALLKEKLIGPPLSFSACFGVKFNTGPSHRIFNLALGGGALLDLGIYPVSIASMLFGKQPQEIQAVAQMGPTGVDINDSLSFLYDRGETASLHTSVIAQNCNQGVLAGEKGTIKIRPPMHHTKKLIVTLGDDQPILLDCDYQGHGFNYEIQHVCDCLHAGKIQSDIMPLDESIAIMQTMDTIRQQWGLRYPGE